MPATPRPVRPERPKTPEEHLRDGTASKVSAQNEDGVVFTPDAAALESGEERAGPQITFTDPDVIASWPWSR